MRYAQTLLSSRDFVGLTETRDNEVRRLCVDEHLIGDGKLFSCLISSYKGGVGLLITSSFLLRFDPVNEVRDWLAIEEGRVCRLSLSGPHGCLDMFVVYLDPSLSRGAREN